MRLFVFSNIFVALCAVALTMSTHLAEGIEASWSTLALVFSATLTIYNLDRLVGTTGEDAHEGSARHDWIRRWQRPLWGVAILSGALTVIALYFVPRAILVGVAPLAIIAGAYSIPIAGRRLKDVPGMKTALIAGVWALVTAGIPFLVAGRGLWSTLFEPAILERFLFIYAITIPFEIRDIERDRSTGVVSIVHVLGTRRSQLLAVALLAGFAVSAAVRFLPDSPELAITLVVSAALTVPLIALSNPDRRDFYYSVVMDGTMLIQAGLVALAVT